MHVYLKQEFMTLHDTFFVYTAAEEQQYRIDENTFSLGHKLKISREGKVVARVEQAFFGLKPNFTLYDDENNVSYPLRRAGHIEDGEYIIEKLNWHTGGDIVGLSYAILNDSGEQIASVNLRETPIGNALDIYILNPKNEVLAIAAVVAINSDRKDQKSKSANPEKYA